MQSPRETGFFAPIGYGVADFRYPWVIAGCGPVPAGTSAHLHRQADMEYSLRWLHVSHGIGLQLGCAQATHIIPPSDCPRQRAVRQGDLVGGDFASRPWGGSWPLPRPLARAAFYQGIGAWRPSFSSGWLLPRGSLYRTSFVWAGVLYPAAGGHSGPPVIDPT